MTTTGYQRGILSICRTQKNLKLFKYVNCGVNEKYNYTIYLELMTKQFVIMDTIHYTTPIHYTTQPPGTI